MLVYHFHQNNSKIIIIKKTITAKAITDNIADKQFRDMPAKKNRSRYGNGNSSSSSSGTQANSSSINKFVIANNINGIAANNYNGYHNNIEDHPIKSTSTYLNSTTSNITSNSAKVSAITFTVKQQQQLDRNAFLLTLTKDQLKIECRKRGQKTTGTKTELVARHLFSTFINNNNNLILVLF